jgi:hypothetical protein
MTSKAAPSRSKPVKATPAKLIKFLLILIFYYPAPQQGSLLVLAQLPKCARYSNPVVASPTKPILVRLIGCSAA